MRIVHLADTHLGFRQFSGKLDPETGLNQRESDVYRSWHRAIEIAIERRVDAVIHAGDLFDSPRPSHRALREALDGFARLKEAGIPALVIAGNHSTPRFRSSGSVFEILERFGVHCAWDKPATVRLGDVAFHAVPHEPDAAQLATDIECLALDGHATANVLILHAEIGDVPKGGYGEVNAVELDADLLTRVDFDYIALGHLHRYQAPQVNAIYPGSLERLDFADLEDRKTVLEIDLSVAAGLPGFATRHPLTPRPVLEIEVDCADCDPQTVVDRIETEADGKPLDGAIVRVRMTALQRDVWHALDFEALADIFRPCLHYVLSVGHAGLQASAMATDEPELAFVPFARDRVPAGLDADRVIGIAQRFLKEAAEDEAAAE